MISIQALLVIVYAISAKAYLLSEYCTQETIGATEGYPVILPQATLYPGGADWDVPIPTVPECPNAAGVKAVVCDKDKPPSARLISLKELLVHRIGNLLEPGKVQITVYCPVYSPGLVNQEVHNVPPVHIQPSTGNILNTLTSPSALSIVPAGYQTSVNVPNGLNGVPNGFTSGLNVVPIGLISNLNTVPTTYTSYPVSNLNPYEVI